MTLWVPSFVRFRDNTVNVIQAGVLWWAFLMVNTVMQDDGAPSCG
ncbi:MAG: hypothetical protein ACOYJV_02925 [Aminivibrio sp.]